MNDDRDDYCRSIESYLCRKNDGHLIRIVGPSFELVTGWAEQGIPLRVVYRGVDRYFERYYSRGPRRRPVRIDFCDADVLDAFDEWRRSVGVGSSGAAGHEHEEERAGRHRESLSVHLEKTIARLAARRAGADETLDGTLDEVVRELDAARAESSRIRGERRDVLLRRLRELDSHLVDTARRSADPEVLERLSAEAHAQLAPFRDRMAPDAYVQSHQTCVDRLLREHARLPSIAFD